MSVNALRQVGPQFPANGRKSNGTSVHRFCSFIWASRPRCELTNSQISTLRFLLCLARGVLIQQ
jgi:hypothetical protein